MRIRLVYADRAGAVDGIRGYTTLLAAALNATPGVTASWGGPGSTVPPSDVVLLQYNPFSYGRWGLAPGILLWSTLLRLRHPRCGFALMVHEPYVAAVNLRARIMWLWQRPQLILLRLLADRVLVVSHDAARRCGGRMRPPRIVPVGSNLPDARRQRTTARGSMGAAAGEIVLVGFAASTAGRVQKQVAASVQAVVAGGSRCILLVLGVANAAPDGLPPAVRVHHPGYADEAELAHLMAAGDIFLATYIDGISTRRTGLMAALQHGLPVVGTTTPGSDPVLLSTDAIVGVPVDDVESFGQAVARLAGDPAQRERRGRAARSLYEASFSWEQITDQILCALRAARP